MALLSSILNLVKIKKIFVGVPVIIKNSKNEILLGKRSNFVFYPNYWGLPGGMIDYKEYSKETAKREIKEELGIDIKITKRSKNIYESMPTKSSSLQTISIVYYGKITKGYPFAKSETKEVKWFKPKEIKKMKLAYNHKEILKKEGII
jgi:mutator protein MutT